MRTRPIALLARRLLTQYRIHKSWTKAAEQLNVLTPDGEPSRGLAYHIACLGYMPGHDVMRRLIRDGAIPAPTPQPINLDWQTRKAIINALREREPLPPPSAKVVREFKRWLACRPIR